MTYSSYGIAQRKNYTDGYKSLIKHNLIKITYEKSSLETTFLDVTVFKGPKFRTTGFFDYKTHVKPTNSRTYVHAFSYHPEGTRKAVIDGEIHRFFRTNSSNLQVSKHISALIDRGYRITQIKKYVREVLSHLYIRTRDLETVMELTEPVSGDPMPNDIIIAQRQRCYPLKEGLAEPLDPQSYTEPNLIAYPRGIGIRIVSFRTCKLTLTKTGAS